MEERGFGLGNLDATIILQRPKLSPHKPAINENLCRLLKAHPSTVNIKVRTLNAPQAPAGPLLLRLVLVHVTVHRSHGWHGCGSRACTPQLVLYHGPAATYLSPGITVLVHCF